jgi:hypothetical protein
MELWRTPLQQKTLSVDKGRALFAANGNRLEADSKDTRQ